MSKGKSRVIIRNEVPEVVHNEQKQRYSWGKDDKLPNKLLRIISDSGTATSCVSKLKTFISGTGFLNEDSASFKVNQDQTANELAADLSGGTGIFEGFAMRVLYRLDGQPGSVYRVPVKCLRANENGTWRYNKKMGERGYKENEDITFRPYTPNISAGERQSIIAAEIKDHKKQLGEILMVFQAKEIEGGDIYPMPDCYSGIDDIESDAALQRQEKRNIKKGFKANTIIALPYEIDDQQKDNEKKTDADHFDEKMRNFTKEDGDSVLVLEGKNEKARPMVYPFPIGDILNGVAGARDRVPRAVCRHMNVPPVLVGLDVAAILGNTQALVNSMKMFLVLVGDRQAMICRAYKMLFPAMDWKIGKVNIFDYMPPEVLAVLTDDEKRSLAGYDPLITSDQSEGPTLAESLGKDGLQSVINVLTNTGLTPEQKKQSLVILFGITEEHALRLTLQGNPNGGNN